MLSPDVPGSLTLNNNQLIVDAARKGLGIAYVPTWRARSSLDDGTLIMLQEAWDSPSNGQFLYFPHDRHISFAMTAFPETVKSSLTFTFASG